jgi:hypothetical protein
MSTALRELQYESRHLTTSDSDSGSDTANQQQDYDTYREVLPQLSAHFQLCHIVFTLELPSDIPHRWLIKLSNHRVLGYMFLDYNHTSIAFLVTSKYL